MGLLDRLIQKGVKVVKPPKASNLLTDQMSGASRGLLGILSQADDDVTAMNRARYVAPPGAKVVAPDLSDDDSESSDAGPASSDKDYSPVVNSYLGVGLPSVVPSAQLEVSVISPASLSSVALPVGSNTGFSVQRSPAHDTFPGGETISAGSFSSDAKETETSHAGPVSYAQEGEDLLAMRMANTSSDPVLQSAVFKAPPSGVEQVSPGSLSSSEDSASSLSEPVLGGKGLSPEVNGNNVTVLQSAINNPTPADEMISDGDGSSSSDEDSEFSDSEPYSDDEDYDSDEYDE
jgi:hypothetical protein